MFIIKFNIVPISQHLLSVTEFLRKVAASLITNSWFDIKVTSDSRLFEYIETLDCGLVYEVLKVFFRYNVSVLSLCLRLTFVTAYVNTFVIAKKFTHNVHRNYLILFKNIINVVNHFLKPSDLPSNVDGSVSSHIMS